MRAISLTQPWATLWAMGIKRIETRGYKCQPGEIFIHATAKKMTRKERERYMTHDDFAVHRRYCPDPDLLPHSAIVGMATIVNCLSTTHLMNLFCYEHAGEKKLHTDARSIEGRVIKPNEEYYLGDYNTGRWGWVSRDPLLFKEPILNIKGSLSIWNTNPFDKSSL